MNSSAVSYQVTLLEKHLINIGYKPPEGTVVSDYSFVAGPNRLGRADLLACANPMRHDISTACIVVRDWPNGDDKMAALKDFSRIGAPLAFLALPEYVEIWPIRTALDSHSQPQNKITYNDLSSYFDQHKNELSPRSLLNAKRGQTQLSFFDIDPALESFARNITRKALVEKFESALGAVSSIIREKSPRAITRLAIWILAASILQDKMPARFNAGERNVQALFKQVRQEFPGFFRGFRNDVLEVGLETVETMYDHLRGGGFVFRSLTNDMLAYFYENTLVDPGLRKELGIYYTPRVLAEQILQRLPIEDTPLEERYILDGTCGSGNLLLAGYDRLSSLLPAKWNSQDSHTYLLKHLWGIDKDDFACEVARLSLLLYDLPMGDSWNVKQSDVFQIAPVKTFGQRPKIIVGNPPFKEMRQEERTQRAAQIMNLYLDWLAPEGLLGVVLPLTFLHNFSAREARAKLLETCDVLEVWHLQEGAIPMSSAAVAIVIARRRLQSAPSKNYPSALTRVIGKDKAASRLISYTVSQNHWVLDSQRRMSSSPFGHIWHRSLAHLLPAEPNFCTFHNGVQVGKKNRKSLLSDQNQGVGWRPVLNRNTPGQAQALQPFVIRWEIAPKYIKYPSDKLQWPRTPAHFQIPIKVIVNATRNSSSPWRFYAAIDRNKLVVTENFHYLLPTHNATAEELVAVFNSAWANAWYAGENYQRDVNLDRLKTIPFPNFTSEQRILVRRLVAQIEKLQQNFAGDKETLALRRLLEQLDDIIFAAYSLEPQERAFIRAWMGQFPRPGLEHETTSPRTKPGLITPLSTEKVWRVTGDVKDVDVEKETITLRIEGRGDYQTITISEAMPGWVLRPGAAFEADIAWEQRHETNVKRLHWKDFRPLEFGYFSEEELIREIEMA